MAQAIPSYCKSAFLLPPSTLQDEIQKIMNSFWWGSNINSSKFGLKLFRCKVSAFKSWIVKMEAYMPYTTSMITVLHRKNQSSAPPLQQLVHILVRKGREQKKYEYILSTISPFSLSFSSFLSCSPTLRLSINWTCTQDYWMKQKTKNPT